jgi:hypothetical protein
VERILPPQIAPIIADRRIGGVRRRGSTRGSPCQTPAAIGPGKNHDEPKRAPRLSFQGRRGKGWSGGMPTTRLFDTFSAPLSVRRPTLSMKKERLAFGSIIAWHLRRALSGRPRGSLARWSEAHDYRAVPRIAVLLALDGREIGNTSRTCAASDWQKSFADGGMYLCLSQAIAYASRSGFCR